MEAITVAKSMAARTKQRLDINQELIGQGLSNIGSSFFQGYAVSGSFSRNAVNMSAGAATGFSSVVTAFIVSPPSGHLSGSDFDGGSELNKFCTNQACLESRKARWYCWSINFYNDPDFCATP